MSFAHDTDHEKIIRSIGLALSIVLFGQEDKADTLIESLCVEKDQILRYSGCLVIGMAYIGTADNKAIRKLLHFAVDDVSDEVGNRSKFLGQKSGCYFFSFRDV